MRQEHWPEGVDVHIMPTNDDTLRVHATFQYHAIVDVAPTGNEAKDEVALADAAEKAVRAVMGGVRAITEQPVR